jgi:hypothetical protein
MWNRTTGLLLVSLIQLHCAQDPTSPRNAGTQQGPTDGRSNPSFEILDAAHAGVKGFYLLPPAVPKPAYSGVTDGSLLSSLRVVVCDKGTSAQASCTSSVKADFSASSGTASEVIRYDAAGQLYIVNWQTDKSLGGALLVDHYYRLRVFAAGQELGHADIDPVRSASDLKNLDVGNSIPLVNGRTLPIKFRIEQGAISVLPSAGGSAQVGTSGGLLATAGGNVAASIPSDALPAPTTISVAPSAAQPASNAIAGTVYDFGPSGTQFAQPITVAIAYDPSALGGTPEWRLRLFTGDGAGWAEIQESRVDTAANVVRGPVSHFSLVGIGTVPPVAIVQLIDRSRNIERREPSDYVDADCPGLFVILRDAADGAYLAGREVEVTSSDPNVLTIDSLRSSILGPSPLVVNRWYRGVESDCDAWPAMNRATTRAYYSINGAGTATVSARSEGVVSNDFVFIAEGPVASVQVTPTLAQLEEGSTLQVSAELKDIVGTVLTGRALEWSSSNQALATVSATGLVTAAARGSVTLTATSEGISGHAEITVVQSDSTGSGGPAPESPP